MAVFGWNVMKEQVRPKIHLHLLVLSILIQAVGAILTKYAAMGTTYEGFYGIPFELVFYGIILACMGLQVLVWQYALRYYPLSFAYPFRSLVSFIVLFSAFVLFNESVTVMNVVGLSVITLGVFYLAKDKEIFS